MAYTHDTIDTVKATYNLETYIENLLGPPTRQSRSYKQWLCPFHADTDPSLTVFPGDQGWYCFGCEAGTDIINFVECYYKVDFKDAMKILTAELNSLTPQQLTRMAETHERHAQDAQERARRKRRLAAKLLAEADELEAWADALMSNARALRFLADKGVTEAVALHFGLGYHKHGKLGPSIAIPWMFRGKLRAIQYRAIGSESDERYRWHVGGNPTLYNADVVPGNGPLCIVEGAIKAMVLTQEGLETAGIVNKTGWRSEWGPHLAHRPTYIMLDPDAMDQACHVAADIGPSARVVDMPAKPDDLVTMYGWRASDFAWLFSQARVV